MERKQKNIRKLIGRIEDRYYICDYVFRNGGSHGACATVLMPVSKERYEEETNPYNEDTQDRFRDLWAEAAQDRRTDKDLESFVKNIIACNGDEAVYSFSGYEYWDMVREAVPELTEEDYPVLECVGGGRSFHIGMKWDELYNAKLWELIEEYEAD